MKTYFRDLDVECWRHKGRLGSNEPSICLFKSEPQSCNPLLRAIEEVTASGPAAKRTVTFKPCPRPNCRAKLRLVLLAESEDLRRICVSTKDDTVTIEFTPEGVGMLQEAILAWQDGAEDFGIPPTWNRKERRELGKKDLASGELWFWGPYYAGP